MESSTKEEFRELQIQQARGELLYWEKLRKQYLEKGDTKRVSEIDKIKKETQDLIVKLKTMDPFDEVSASGFDIVVFKKPTKSAYFLYNSSKCVLIDCFSDIDLHTEIFQRRNCTSLAVLLTDTTDENVQGVIKYFGNKPNVEVYVHKSKINEFGNNFDNIKGVTTKKNNEGFPFTDKIKLKPFVYDRNKLFFRMGKIIFFGEFPPKKRDDEFVKHTTTKFTHVFVSETGKANRVEELKRLLPKKRPMGVDDGGKAFPEPSRPELGKEKEEEQVIPMDDDGKKPDIDYEDFIDKDIEDPIWDDMISRIEEGERIDETETEYRIRLLNHEYKLLLDEKASKETIQGIEAKISVAKLSKHIETILYVIDLYRIKLTEELAKSKVSRRQKEGETSFKIRFFSDELYKLTDRVDELEEMKRERSFWWTADKKEEMKKSKEKIEKLKNKILLLNRRLRQEKGERPLFFKPRKETSRLEPGRGKTSPAQPREQMPPPKQKEEEVDSGDASPELDKGKASSPRREKTPPKEKVDWNTLYEIAVQKFEDLYEKTEPMSYDELIKREQEFLDEIDYYKSRIEEEKAQKEASRRNKGNASPAPREKTQLPKQLPLTQPKKGDIEQQLRLKQTELESLNDLYKKRATSQRKYDDRKKELLDEIRFLQETLEEMAKLGGEKEGQVTPISIDDDDSGDASSEIGGEKASPAPPTLQSEKVSFEGVEGYEGVDLVVYKKGKKSAYFLYDPTGSILIDCFSDVDLYAEIFKEDDEPPFLSVVITDTTDQENIEGVKKYFQNKKDVMVYAHKSFKLKSGNIKSVTTESKLQFPHTDTQGKKHTLRVFVYDSGKLFVRLDTEIIFLGSFPAAINKTFARNTTRSFKHVYVNETGEKNRSEELKVRLPEKTKKMGEQEEEEEEEDVAGPTPIQELYDRVLREYFENNPQNIPGFNPEDIQKWVELSERYQNLSDELEKSNITITKRDSLDKDTQFKIRVLQNLIIGPKILLAGKKGYGLYADRKYTEGNTVKVVYGGRVSKIYDDDRQRFGGDYVFMIKNPKNKNQKREINGAYGYKLSEKGHMMNKSRDYNMNANPDVDVDFTNGKIKMHSIHPNGPIFQGDELLLDYGPEYIINDLFEYRSDKTFVYKNSLDRVLEELTNLVQNTAIPKVESKESVLNYLAQGPVSEIEIIEGNIEENPEARNLKFTFNIKDHFVIVIGFNLDEEGRENSQSEAIDAVRGFMKAKDLSKKNPVFLEPLGAFIVDEIPIRDKIVLFDCYIYFIMPRMNILSGPIENPRYCFLEQCVALFDAEKKGWSYTDTNAVVFVMDNSVRTYPITKNVEFRGPKPVLRDYCDMFKMYGEDDDIEGTIGDIFVTWNDFYNVGFVAGDEIFETYLKLAAKSLAMGGTRHSIQETIVDFWSRMETAALKNMVICDVENIDSLIPLINDANEDVEIRESQIPKAGNGLFAKRTFKNGDIICRYSGFYSTSEDYYNHNKTLHSLHLNFGDIEEIPAHHDLEPEMPIYVDADVYYRAGDPGGFANSLPWKGRMGSERFYNNAIFATDDEEIIVNLIATDEIEAGAEIFVEYGCDYPWETLKDTTNKKPLYDEKQIESWCGKRETKTVSPQNLLKYLRMLLEKDKEKVEEQEEAEEVDEEEEKRLKLLEEEEDEVEKKVRQKKPVEVNEDKDLLQETFDSLNINKVELYIDIFDDPIVEERLWKRFLPYLLQYSVAKMKNRQKGISIVKRLFAKGIGQLVFLDPKDDVLRAKQKFLKGSDVVSMGGMCTRDYNVFGTSTFPAMKFKRWWIFPHMCYQIRDYGNYAKRVSTFQEANCELERQIRDEPFTNYYIQLIAKRDIEPGEEITYFYSDEE
jgi:hypothetical protein